jgi:hypothetical protein
MKHLQMPVFRKGDTEQVVTPAKAGVQMLDLTGFRRLPE